ncbi:uncharacterized protein F4822DRAFT_117971 [Hypoxylon trugodes]|uniref:uncharacterized protein n=1 Tax=Hypoxylon trugodes TaxID=326681 RepID=UPI00219805B8|nr:uncharacterized protein F4822DRAFT_117971 [Hypoxylon trugodes]KAI1392173.1 hypothetical protein F4822DRAFT_117971 [Hypoxylon trugodes]
MPRNLLPLHTKKLVLSWLLIRDAGPVLWLSPRYPPYQSCLTRGCVIRGSRPWDTVRRYSVPRCIDTYLRVVCLGLAFVDGEVFALIQGWAWTGSVDGVRWEVRKVRGQIFWGQQMIMTHRCYALVTSRDYSPHVLGGFVRGREKRPTVKARKRRIRDFPVLYPRDMEIFRVGPGMHRRLRREYEICVVASFRHGACEERTWGGACEYVIT